jgi:hypothetical protein
VPAPPPRRPRPPRRRLEWRPDPPRRADPRDQLALRLGWVRLWLRGVTLGLGLWLIGASLLLWPQLQALMPPFFFAGLLIMPAAGLLALLTWVVPLPFERRVRCARCGGGERVLALPWRLPYTCRHCRARGEIERGEIRLAIPAPPGGEGRGAARR